MGFRYGTTRRVVDRPSATDGTARTGARIAADRRQQSDSIRMQAAIHAMPTPVIVVRSGRVVEVKPIGLRIYRPRQRAIVGCLVSEVVLADPAEALIP